MSLIVIFIIAIGLSMDAFSLSLIYGTLDLKPRMQKLMSITVGIFHFFMPLIGYKIGKMILDLINVNPDILIGIIFIILAIEMILSLKKEEQVKILNGIGAVTLFAFTVSIDSFSTGISLGIANVNILLPCIIFSLTSLLFTYIGVMLGKKLVNKFGMLATLIGAVILLIIGISYVI